MSSRRSRFKVAANIPVRRKPGLTSTPAVEEPKVVESLETTASTVPIIHQEDTSIQTSVTPESIKEVSEEVKSSDGVVKIEEKQVFKLIKKPFHLPSHNRRKRHESGGNTDDEIKISSTSDKPNEINTNSGTEPVNVLSGTPVVVENDNKITPERPTTPVSVIPVVPSSPLKSPARPRFVRPALVDSARRLSIHLSSASESEDDARKTQKIRRISEMSKLEPAVPTEFAYSTLTTNIDSETNECVRLAMLPKRKRPKISNFVRKIAEARRDFNKKFAREKPDRSNLKMFDLIFYNPRAPALRSPNSKNKVKDNERTVSISEQEKLVSEEEADDPEKEAENTETEETELALPVPQVKIGANGEIILDEKSVVIETTDVRRGREALLNAVPCEDLKKGSYYGKRHNRFKEWSPIETKLFYKALNSMGTDFALMQSLFPTRTRAELKNKFKKEERINAPLIDRAISCPAQLNTELLKIEIEKERELVEQETKRKIEEKRRLQQERQEQAVRKANFMTTKEDSWNAALKGFIGHPVRDNMSSVQERRSSRGPQRRKLSEDFVNPFEVECEAGPSSNNPREEKENNKQIPSSKRGEQTNNFEPTQMKRPKTNHVLKKPKKVINASYPLVPPDLESENASVEELSDNDFVTLLQQNLQTLGPTTIRIEAPMQFDEQFCVQMEVPKNTSRLFPKRLSTVSKTFKVESNVKCKISEEAPPIENNFTIPAESPPPVKDFTSEGTLPMEMETIYTFSPDKITNETVVEEESDFTPNLTEEICYEQDIVEEQIETSEYLEPDSNPIETKPEPKVDYRTTGGLQYAIIKDKTSPEEQRTYLAGLTPGSFVFMANESKDLKVPLAQRCSMYMIKEKVSPEGTNELFPMPVILPPPLMSLITEELNCK